MKIDNVVFIKQNRVLTNSRVLAETFGKQHKDVLRKIEKQLAEYPNDFQQRNFTPLNIIEKNAIGKETNLPYYEMTKDGFMAIGMTFTGKKAAAYRVAIIDEFNRRGDELTKRGLSIEDPLDALEIAIKGWRDERTAHEETKTQLTLVKETSRISNYEKVLLDNLILTRAGDLLIELGWTRPNSKDVVCSLIKKCIKAVFCGARYSNKYDLIALKDYPRVVEFVEGLSKFDITKSSKCFNTDAGLLKLKDYFRTE